MFSNILLQLIVLFLPTQLGLHFWPEFSRAAGIRIDYLSPTLYFTDILIILFLFLNSRNLLEWLKKKNKAVGVFLLCLAINILFSISPSNALFWWIRLVVYLLFFLSLQLQKIRWSQIKLSLITSTVFVVVLEVAQFLQQSSLGGIFYWLGERDYSSSTSGIARISFLGQETLRPQSTFSHPNSLAGYLLIVLYLMHKKGSLLWQRLLILLGIILTLSKGAILTLVLLIVFGEQSLLLISTFLTASTLLLFLPTVPSQLQFVSDRLFHLSPSRKILLANPLFGVGLGGFIPALVEKLQGSFLLSSKLQPVHNLLILVVTEVGIVGVGSMVYATKRFVQKSTLTKILGLVTIVVITGTFDHYWLTLPQNKLILLLAAAVLL